jgi:DNA repair protein RadA/Sms
MAVTKNRNIYVCTSCGYETPKWYGRCPDCGEWNTLTEEVRQQVAISKSTKLAAQTAPKVNYTRLSEISSDDSQRYRTGVGELDRVLGGESLPDRSCCFLVIRNRKIHASAANLSVSLQGT